jgi:hypothetical protein
MPGLCGISWNFTVIGAVTGDAADEVIWGLRRDELTVGGWENSVGTIVFDGGVGTGELFMVG